MALVNGMSFVGEFGEEGSKGCGGRGGVVGAFAELEILAS